MTSVKKTFTTTTTGARIAEAESIVIKPASNDDKPKRIKLDRIDRQILSDLQANGRMTNVELAERAGISAPPCLRRVRALEDAGYIRSYHADLNAPAMGYTIQVFAQVSLDKQSEKALVEFENAIQGWPEVRECYMLAGDTDYLLKIVSKDWETYQEFITKRLTAAPHVANIRSSMAIRAAKKLPGIPVELDTRVRLGNEDEIEDFENSVAA